tara:strand:- start:4018 stop:4167 length:150 start_codon:yes stop_codon:yes gene_type:complete
MYEYYRGHAGDTGGYGVSIYVHCNRSGFVSVGGVVVGAFIIIIFMTVLL